MEQPAYPYKLHDETPSHLRKCIQGIYKLIVHRFMNATSVDWISYWKALLHISATFLLTYWYQVSTMTEKLAHIGLFRNTSLCVPNDVRGA